MVFQEESVKTGDGWSGKLYGEVPVQGEGEVDLDKWFFRARGNKWSFEILHKKEHKINGVWGVWPDSGYMPYEEAWKLIEECISIYRKKILTEEK